jgi:transcriptional regulator GlxA family with amidase domain
MQRNFAVNLPIEALAKRTNMSPRNFIRRFKAATGRLPGHYLQVLRINVAKALLEEGASSVQAVCSAVGYDDVAFFRKLFKKLTGMTPLEYRNRFAGAGPVHPDPESHRTRAVSH